MQALHLLLLAKPDLPRAHPKAGRQPAILSCWNLDVNAPFVRFCLTESGFRVCARRARTGAFGVQGHGSHYGTHGESKQTCGDLAGRPREGLSRTCHREPALSKKPPKLPCTFWRSPSARHSDRVSSTPAKDSAPLPLPDRGRMPSLAWRLHARRRNAAASTSRRPPQAPSYAPRNTQQRNAHEGIQIAAESRKSVEANRVETGTLARRSALADLLAYRPHWRPAIGGPRLSLRAANALLVDCGPAARRVHAASCGAFRPATCRQAPRTPAPPSPSA